MRITIISRAWPPQERSGVSLAALSHARLLIEQGHEVSIIGATNDLDTIPLPLSNRVYVPARGSGSLYSPVRIDKLLLRSAIQANDPDLVVIEAWQTALTDSAIGIAHQLQIPILMISHGISLQPHQHTIPQLLRSLAWIPYRYFRLPGLLKKLSAITTLDEFSISKRFFDRDLAKKYNVPVVALKNFSAHHFEKFYPREDRHMQILVVGYFSAIKNQLGVIKLLSKLPSEVSCCFVGDRRGRYFEACQKRVTSSRLVDRVSFLQDNECNLSEKISQSMLIFSPSTTEVLPMTLIEAMECGTPFVATSVGGINHFLGGILADDEKSQIKAIETLVSNPEIWQRYSDAGQKQVNAEFTEERIALQLAGAVKLACERGGQ